MKWSMLLASRGPVTFPPNSRFAVVRASPVGKSCPLGVEQRAGQRHCHEHPEHRRHEPGCTSEREHEPDRVGQARTSKTHVVPGAFASLASAVTKTASTCSASAT